MNNRYSPITRQTVENPDLLHRSLSEMQERLAKIEAANEALKAVARNAQINADIAHKKLDAGVVGNSRSADAALVQLGLDKGQHVKAQSMTVNRAPLVTDDANAGFSVFSPWVDTATGDAYICTDAKVGTATWKKISP